MITAEYAREISSRYKTIEGGKKQEESPELLEILTLFRKMVEKGINEASVNGKRVYRINYPLPKTEIEYWRKKRQFQGKKKQTVLPYCISLVR